MEWVSLARKHVKKTMARFPKLFFKVSKDFATDLLCKELEKVPVPFVGTILSKMVKDAVNPEDKSAPGLKAVLNELHHMKISDDNFVQGLARKEDITRLETIIGQELGALKETLTKPLLVVKYPEYRPDYPQTDNELFFSLMNIGSGAVKVPEVYLNVEKWEPETKVDFTAMGAPVEILRLKVMLSPNKAKYPLLQLNNQSYRRFGAYSEGAEDVCIQMSSEKNARYHVRIRIPYKDLATDQEAELLYPPASQPPLLVAFSYAPGWNNTITPDNMLVRGQVLNEIIRAFQNVTAILKASVLVEINEEPEQINQRLRETGFSMGLEYMPFVLNRFIPPVAEMIRLENQMNALTAVLELVHQTLRFPESVMHFRYDEQTVDTLCVLFSAPEIKKQIHQFFAEPDKHQRSLILAKISEAIR